MHYLLYYSSLELDTDGQEIRRGAQRGTDDPVVSESGEELVEEDTAEDLIETEETVEEELTETPEEPVEV